MPISSVPNKRIILAITGATGAIYGIRTLEIMRQIGIETHLIISRAARSTITAETEWSVENVIKLADKYYGPDEIGASIASGSFVRHGMLILPCTIKTLSAVANSYTSSLVSRAADVTLKEGRPLLLAVREAPFHAGHLRIMRLAASAGAIIFPPIPTFYNRPKSIEEVIDETISRMLLRIGIEIPGRKEWNGSTEMCRSSEQV